MIRRFKFVYSVAVYVLFINHTAICDTMKDLGDIDCSAEVYKTSCAMNETCTARCLYPCNERKQVVLWGTSTYTYDSAICKSAVHDLRISTWNTSARNVVFRRIPFYSFYRGSVRFGFSSTHYGKLGYRDRGSFIFLNPRVSEKILDVSSVHRNYLYMEESDHTQTCIIYPQNRKVRFDTYINRELTPSSLEKNPPAIKAGNLSVYQITWSGSINLGGNGFQCIPSKSMLSIITSLAMRKDAYFLPRHLTITANVNESITLSMKEVEALPYLSFWQKDSKSLNAFVRYEIRRTSLFLHNIQTGSAGIYSLEYSASAPNSIERKGVVRLIVRACPEKKYGNDCSDTCPECLNGGVCHDITGVCICPPGFIGELCEKACEPGHFGKSCSMECSMDESSHIKNESCKSLLICLPDPYGCSCAAGFKGVSCDAVCEAGEYGAGCTQKRLCNCAENQSCNIFSGLCPNGCIDGWHGDGCVMSYPVLSHPPIALNIAKTNITLSFREWRMDTDIGFGTPASYNILLKLFGTEEWLHEGHIEKQEEAVYNYTLHDLHPGQLYVIAVTVVDISDEEQLEGLETLQVSTLCDRPENPPTILDIEVTKSTVNVSWELPPKEEWNCQEVKVLLMYSSATSSGEIEVTGSSYEFESKPFVPWNISLCLLSRDIDEFSFAECSDVRSVTTLEGSPGIIEKVILDSSTPKTASLQWKEPEETNGIVRSYIVHYWQTGWVHTCTHLFDASDKVVNTSFSYIQLENLNPSATYTGGVVAMTVEEGPMQLINFKTKGDVPYGTPRIIVYQDSSKSVSWSAPYCNTTNGDITFYLLCLSSLDPWDKSEKNHTTSRMTQELTELIPYTRYVLRIYPANNFGPSQNYSELMFTTKSDAPPSPTDLVVYSRTSNSISLSWNKPYPPNGDLNHYIIHYESSDNDNFDYITVPASSTNCSSALWKKRSCFTVNNLKANIIYRMRLEAYNSGVSKGSDPVLLTANTTESVPEAPESVIVSNRNDTSAQIRWIGPHITNGKITYFRIGISLIQTALNFQHNFPMMESVLSEENNYTFNHLLSASVYQVCVDASTKEGFGPLSCTNFSTTSSAPVVKMAPIVLGVYSHGIKIRLYPEMFHGGPICAYFVMVSHVSGKSISKRDVDQDLFRPINCSLVHDEIPSKYVAVKLEHLSSSGEDVIIGDGNCSNGYYNAPLIAGDKYKVGVVALSVYESDYKYSEIKYITRSITIPGLIIRMKPQDAGALFGFLVPFLFVIIIFVVYVYYKRPGFAHKRYNRAMKMKILPQPDDPVFAITNAALDENEELDTESLSEGFSNCIPISELEDFFDRSSKNNWIKQEFMTLPRGQKFPCDTAKLPENKGKNRYGNQLPYDHSRVILQPLKDQPNSDYINANYIDGYKCTRRYIATQGPKLCTMADFWRMVWQEKAYKIFMATNIVEGGRPKCDKYWPDSISNETMLHGNLSVTFCGTQKYANFSIRTFQVLNNETHEVRVVEQFHFQTWPDHGVPPCTTPVMKFIQKGRQFRQDTNAPIVVHCSAGIGRTGTLILLDTMMDMIEAEKKVDLLAHLYLMRCQRSNIVENMDQYIFAYRALSEIFCGFDPRIPCSEFLSKVKDLSDETGAMQIKKEFEVLNKQSHHLSWIDTKAASLPEYMNKNRDQSILPPDRACPSLEYRDCAYVNAVYVDRYKDKNAIIATQYPLTGTVDDFWRIIGRTRCETIVLLQDINFSDPTSLPYWPTEGNIFCGKDYQLICDSTVQEMSLTIYNLKLSLATESDHDISLFHVHGWKLGEQLPEMTAFQFINLVITIEKHTKKNQNSLLCVQCLDGASACGLFCASLMVLDEIKAEDIVNIFEAVKTVRINRPQFIQTLEQYKFLYDMAEVYVSKV